MRSHCTLPLLVCLLGASLCSWPSRAQDQRLHPDMPGEWKVSIEDTYLGAYALPPAEAQDYWRRLNALATVFRETRVLNPPLGFEARVLMRPWTDSSDCTPSPCRTQPVKTQFLLSFCPLFDVGGKMGVASNSALDLGVWVNAVDQTVGATGTPIDGGLRDVNGAPIYGEPRKTDELMGFPLFDYSTLIVTNSRTPYWLPVSREQYLRGRIKAWESDLANLRRDAAVPADPYREWVQSRARRRAEMDRAVAEASKIDPAGAREMRRAFEEAETATERELKENAAAFTSDRAAGIPYLDEQVASLRKELMSMSAAERRAQAWYSGLRFDGTGPVSGLADAGASGARPLITINPDFFDRTRPRATFQMAVVQFGWATGGDADQIRSARVEDYAVHGLAAIAIARMYELMHSMDWRKMAALLSPARSSQ